MTKNTSRTDSDLLATLEPQCATMTWCAGPDTCLIERDHDGSLVVTHTAIVRFADGEPALEVTALWNDYPDATVSPVDLVIPLDGFQHCDGDGARAFATAFELAGTVYDTARDAIERLIPGAVFTPIQ